MVLQYGDSLKLCITFFYIYKIEAYFHSRKHDEKSKNKNNYSPISFLVKVILYSIIISKWIKTVAILALSVSDYDV